MGAIVGGVIAFLVVLGAAGVGGWIFFRRRAAAARINWDYPSYSSVPSTEHDVPPQMRLYVSCFVPVFDSILTVLTGPV